MNMTATGWIMLTIVAYLGVMVGVGVYWSKKNNDASDFYLGGRKLAFRNGIERRSLRYERLAPDGYSGPCVHFGHC